MVATVAIAAVLRGRALAPPAGWTRIDGGPGGGAVWQGVIPGAPVLRTSAIYLPAAPPPRGGYPTLYVLHGFPGDPYSLVFGLRFAAAADTEIAAGRAPPFVAVMPAAGPSPRWRGEWAGVWERWLVGRVVPWAEAQLAPGPERAIAGLSAGGYGAVDVGLRHPLLFRTLESWSGYFAPIRDGPLAHAPPPALAAHDPTLLVEREAPLLRRLGTRVFLSSGDTRDRATAAATRAFAARLGALRIPDELWLAPGGHDGRFWRRQLPAALDYAFADTAGGADRRRREASVPSTGCCDGCASRTSC